MSTTAEETETFVESNGQTALLDLSGREFNPLWVDEKANLFIANNPLHWKAHKLQILIARLEKQAERNPAQFNSSNMIAAINELEKCMEKINEVHGSGAVDQNRNDGTAPAVGEGTPVVLDSGVSADNPFAG